MANSRVGILERLSKGPVFGDGGFVFALEKRGYVQAGPWTPEATVEHPQAVLQLHKEFVRAGSDVCQTFTFYASDDKLNNNGNTAGKKYTCRGINEAACKLAREASDYESVEGGGLVAGGICQTPSYLSGLGKEKVKEEFKNQLEVFRDNKVDFMIVEYFEHVEECEWAIEAVHEYMPKGTAIAANLCIGPEGDLHGVSTKECAVRMANAGADIVGVNCHFDPFVSLKAMALMKQGLEEAGLWKGPTKAPFLMCQPLGYMTPDAQLQGFIDLPEFPFALEPRILTRWEMHKFARDGYEMGVRYIGGCCGFEAYHIRACAEELMTETAKGRGKAEPEGCKKHIPWAGGLKMHTKPWVRARAKKEYWQCLCPSSGRPHSAAMSKPDQWGVTQGDDKLKQNFQEQQQQQQTVAEKLAEINAVHEKTPSEGSGSQPEIEASPMLGPTALDGVRGGYPVPPTVEV